MMKPLLKRIAAIILFLLGYSVQVTLAQDNCYNCDYDSLVNQLNKKQNDTDRIKLLALLVENAPELHAQLPTEKNFEYLVQLVRYNNRAHFIDGAPYEVLLQGFSLWQKDDLQGALADFKKAVELFDGQKKVMIKLLLDIRILFNLLNQQEERYKFYKEKLEYYLTNGPVENTAVCYHGIAGYYTYIANYNLAISNYLKAASVLRQFFPGFYNNEIVAIGRWYSIWGNDAKATQYLELAMQRLKSTAPGNGDVIDSANVTICLNTLSTIAVRHQKYDKALQYVEQSLKVCNKNTERHLYGITLLQKGFVYLEKNSLPQLICTWIAQNASAIPSTLKLPPYKELWRLILPFTVIIRS